MPLDEDLLKAKADLSKSESENFLDRVTSGELPTTPQPQPASDVDSPAQAEENSTSTPCATPTLTAGDSISQEQIEAEHPELMGALNSSEIEYCPYCDGVRATGHVAEHKGGTVGVPEWMQKVLKEVDEKKKNEIAPAEESCCAVGGHAPLCRCHLTGVAVRIW